MLPRGDLMSGSRVSSLCPWVIEELAPAGGGRVREPDEQLPFAELCLSSAVLVGAPVELACRPSLRQQLERMKDVDGQVPEAAAARPGRPEKRVPVESPDSSEPRVENGVRIAPVAERMSRQRRRQSEHVGDLRDVEHRRHRVADDERRDERPARLQPAPRTLALVADV